MVYTMLAPDAVDRIVATETTATAADDGKPSVTLRVYADHSDNAPPQPQPRPCVLYLHSPGFAMPTANAPLTVRLCQHLAAQGAVVATVAYRWPFSDGAAKEDEALADVLVAVDYLCRNKTELGLSSVVLAGHALGGELVYCNGVLAPVSRSPSFAQPTWPSALP